MTPGQPLPSPQQGSLSRSKERRPSPCNQRNMKIFFKIKFLTIWKTYFQRNVLTAEDLCQAGTPCTKASLPPCPTFQRKGDFVETLRNVFATYGMDAAVSRVLRRLSRPPLSTAGRTLDSPLAAQRVHLESGSGPRGFPCSWQLEEHVSSKGEEARTERHPLSRSWSSPGDA